MRNYTNRQQTIIDAYEQLVKDGKEPTNSNIGEIVYGVRSRNSTASVNSAIHNMRLTGCWPYEQEEPQEGKIMKEEKKIETPAIRNYIRGYSPNDEDPEVKAIRQTVRMLNSLQKSASMKKIIEAIKNGAYTKDEMYVLTELSKTFDDLEASEKERVFAYIGAKFKL